MDRGELIGATPQIGAPALDGERVPGLAEDGVVEGGGSVRRFDAGARHQTDRCRGRAPRAAGPVGRAHRHPGDQRTGRRGEGDTEAHRERLARGDGRRVVVPTGSAVMPSGASTDRRHIRRRTESIAVGERHGDRGRAALGHRSPVGGRGQRHLVGIRGQGVPHLPGQLVDVARRPHRVAVVPVRPAVLQGEPVDLRRLPGPPPARPAAPRSTSTSAAGTARRPGPPTPGWRSRAAPRPHPPASPTRSAATGCRTPVPSRSAAVAPQERASATQRPSRWRESVAISSSSRSMRESQSRLDRSKRALSPASYAALICGSMTRLRLERAWRATSRRSRRYAEEARNSGRTWSSSASEGSKSAAP